MLCLRDLHTGGGYACSRTSPLYRVASLTTKAGRGQYVSLGEDSAISASEKLSRVIESLLPPASNIVWALGKEVTAEECLEGLEKAYGITADGDELYLRFSECFQKPGEAASEYLVRLQELMTRVQDTGGVSPDRTNNVRIHQFTRDCLYNKPLLMKLDVKKCQTPPNFVTLLQEVRLEEQREREKKEWRVREQKVVTKRVAVVAEASPAPTDEVKQLQEAVALLQQQLAAVQVSGDHRHGDSAGSGQPRSRWPQPQPQHQVQKPRARYPLICYNCGQQGHRLTQCTNETNAPLVQQQMAARSKPPSGNWVPGNMHRRVLLQDSSSPSPTTAHHKSSCVGSKWAIGALPGIHRGGKCDSPKRRLELT